MGDDDRPKCMTCPHWRPWAHVDGWDGDRDGGPGYCLRFPPSLTAGSGDRLQVDRGGMPTHWGSPVTTGRDSCGEHPAFPKYLAAFDVA